MNIPLELLSYHGQLDFRANKKIFDPIRKKELVVTPEELVRQLLLLYLIHEKKFPKNSLSVEKQVLVNGRPKRFDVLVYDKMGLPLLLVECKAPSVRIDEMVLDQMARYNLALKVNYFLMTNGMTTYCCAIDYAKETFTMLEEIPDFNLLGNF